MLMMPPKPPKPSMTNPRPVARTIGRPQGSAADPADRAAPSTQTTGDLKRGRDREDREHSWNSHKGGQQHLNEFHRVAVLGVHQQMMHAHRQAVDEKQDKRE